MDEKELKERKIKVYKDMIFVAAEELCEGHRTVLDAKKVIDHAFKRIEVINGAESPAVQPGSGASHHRDNDFQSERDFRGETITKAS